jgi:dTDP-4-dehydrorhamnose reductase
MRILVTGSSGMLGNALLKALDAEHEVRGFDVRDGMDITSFNSVYSAVSEFRPDWVLHAAAYTRVDDSESHHEEAHQVNALGSRNVAVAAYENNCPILYYSTDYVFDGKSRVPYRELDTTAPLNEYGRSKLAGEELVRHANPGHLIVRTSWLFGPGGPNFIDKVADRVRAGEALRVVNDQVGSPTLTRDLAAKSMELISRNVRGTYHVTNSGECSWYDLALEIVSILGIEVPVTAIKSSELSLPARRPTYSVLSNYFLQLDGFGRLRSWKEAVAAHLRGRS